MGTNLNFYSSINTIIPREHLHYRNNSVPIRRNPILVDRVQVNTQGSITQQVEDLSQRIEIHSQKVSDLSHRVKEYLKKCEEHFASCEKLSKEIKEHTQRVDAYLQRSERFYKMVQEQKEAIQKQKEAIESLGIKLIALKTRIKQEDKTNRVALVEAKHNELISYIDSAIERISKEGILKREQQKFVLTVDKFLDDQRTAKFKQELDNLLLTLRFLSNIFLQPEESEKWLGIMD